ncbi:catalase family protein [Sphingomonas jatrophae]|uniref:Catalase n=1 Tax=Sphingomonas jatrophae TaxID=1166337 RepID=A0A1I6JM97_9SPHN|nr:catalase family protein [Sphingomonas jatrophae]SFR80096.1 hypothetical protein SAMN05192580_0523 [Sphingomonas jatrophae]
MAAPVRYTPDVETIAPDEAETQAGLDQAMTEILETTSKDYGRAVRSVHAKGHALLKGRLIVAEGLPPELAQGLFAQGGEHEAILRFSTNAGDILDDSISLPRGLALKVLDVEGERLPGSEGDRTQDFILVNAPAFGAPEPKAFLGNLKLLAKTTDKAEWAKKALSATLRTIEAGVEALGGKSALLNQMGGAQQVHPLGETYWTQVPFRYGDHIAKLQLVPVSRELTEVSGMTINAAGRPDALREDINETIVEHGGVWELRVQLCVDLDAMPVEDASKEWDAEASPYRTVARLEVPAQLGWQTGASEQAEGALSFSVWHGLAAHRPLGGINRMRKQTYELSAGYRARFNGCPIHEPATLADVG